VEHVILEALAKVAGIVAPPAPLVPPPPPAPYGRAWAIGLIHAGIRIQMQRAVSNRPGPTPERINRPKLRAERLARREPIPIPYRKEKQA
jgi:hypothetical protein